MKFLLDTHVWIWAENEPEKLGKSCQKVLSDKSSQLFISPISSLEIVQLVYKKKLSLSVALNRWIKASVESLFLETLSFDHMIAVAAYNFQENFHGDPADRILVATARELGLILVTADEAVLELNWVKTLDARK